MIFAEKSSNGGGNNSSQLQHQASMGINGFKSDTNIGGGASTTTNNKQGKNSVMLPEINQSESPKKGSLRGGGKHSRTQSSA